jgi:hypothetical protein
VGGDFRAGAHLFPRATATYGNRATPGVLTETGAARGAFPGTGRPGPLP